MTVADTEQSVLNAYAATLDHIGLIADKLHEVQARLGRAKSDSEQQVLHRVAADYASGYLSDRELCVVYDAFRAVSGPGHTTIWNAIVPISATRIQHLKVRHRREDRCAASSWSGDYPFDYDATPPNDFSVVYVLFDDKNVPCYVGSTKNFTSRLNAHDRDGKVFARWTAHPCADREAAYLLEEKLLREHKPYLNKRGSR